MNSNSHRYFLLPRVCKRHSVTVTGDYSRESWVTGHAGHGSIDWWVTWVMGHKIWPIVSSGPKGRSPGVRPKTFWDLRSAVCQLTRDLFAVANLLVHTDVQAAASKRWRTMSNWEKLYEGETGRKIIVSVFIFQIIPLKRESLKSPAAQADIVAATDFFRFSLTPDVEFKRQLTIKLPLPVSHDDDHVINADDVAVCQTTMTSQDDGLWTVVSGPLKLTRNSVTFDTGALTK